jgi:hypothetical protein
MKTLTDKGFGFLWTAKRKMKKLLDLQFIMLETGWNAAPFFKDWRGIIRKYLAKNKGCWDVKIFNQWCPTAPNFILVCGKFSNSFFLVSNALL